MTIQPTRILFVTDQPTLVMNLREALSLSGFDREPVMLRPRAGLPTLGPEDAVLLIVDVKRAPAPDKLADAVRSSPQSRFVLCGGAITPRMFLVAIETGVHGVLATGLAVEEAAQALTRIWNGERQFRFDCAAPQPAAPPPPERADFDRAWMFGQYV